MDEKQKELLFDLFDKIGPELVLEVKKILESSNKVATGTLLRSIDYAISSNKGSYGLTLLAEDYWYWVNYGRKPNSKMPPLQAIEDWIKVKGIQFALPSGRPMSQRSMAFLIARSIGRKGFVGINFLEQAIAYINKTFADDLKNQWGDEYTKELERSFRQLQRNFNKD